MARRSHKHSRKCGHKKQRGGGPGTGQFGFTGPAGMSAAGVPLDSRGASYSHCGWDNARSVVPDIGRYMTTQFGGSRKKRKAQRGGGCGCAGGPMPPTIAQRGGGGGTGGYSTLLSNDLGKVHAGYAVAPCPPAPQPTQVGGAAESSPEQIVSYTTGYGYSPSSVVSTSSAHYLDQQAYNKTCSGGARRTRRRRHRKTRSRRHH